MARLRFSIAGLMALVLVLGIDLAALKHPSERAASLLFALILASLLTSILGAMVRLGRERMAWTGFAAFGWTYLLLSLWFLPWLTGDQLRPPVLPSEYLEDLYPYIGPSPPPGPEPLGQDVYRLSHVRFVGMRAADWKPFRQICNTLGTVLFALLGAMLGRMVAIQQNPPTRGVADSI
jgi:hypothetical protein